MANISQKPLNFGINPLRKKIDKGLTFFHRTKAPSSTSEKMFASLLQ